ncbi:LPS assembly lipoprotein LptE [Marinomonas arenicola]|uniref:LPS-assembly lipoprotein LptE n=1 Tax=Marinomonas arenicola TaxID=569601 RepID=A0ABU9G4P5_9GAMM
MLVSFNKTTRYFFLALIAMSVTACGFHLRGQVAIPQALKTITLTSDAKSNTFNTSLRIALSRAGVTVIDPKDAGDDVLELKVNAITTSDTVLARNSSNDITQIERRMSTSYFIRQEDGKSLYGPRTVSTSKTLSNQNSEESTKAAYNKSKEEDMSEELANQLIYDLGYAPLK